MAGKGIRVGVWGLVLLMLTAAFSGCLGDDAVQPEVENSAVVSEAALESQLPVESSQAIFEESSSSQPEAESMPTSVALEFYSAMEENDAYPYTLTEKAKSMLAEKEELFLDNRPDGREENTDYTIEYRAIDKSIERYGDKLFYLPDALVVQIFETDVDEETTITEMLVCDEEMHFYQVLSLCGYEDIYTDDLINIYALPLAKSSFSNVSGGTTLVIVAAASFIEKAS